MPLTGARPLWEGLICPFDRDAVNKIAISSIALKGLSVWSKFFIPLFKLWLIFIDTTKMGLSLMSDTV